MSTSQILHGASVGVCSRCRLVALLTYQRDQELLCSGCGIGALRGCSSCNTVATELFEHQLDRTIGLLCSDCLPQFSGAGTELPECWKCHNRRPLYSKLPNQNKPAVCAHCFFRYCAREKICGDCGCSPKNLRFRNLHSRSLHRICSKCKSDSIDYTVKCLLCPKPSGRRRHKQTINGVTGWVCYTCHLEYFVPHGRCGRCKEIKPLQFDHENEKLCKTCHDELLVGRSRCARCNLPGFHSRWHPLGKRFGRVCANCHPILRNGRRRCPRCSNKAVLRLRWPNDPERRKICQSCRDALTRVIAPCNGPCGKTRELSCLHPKNKELRICEPCFKLLTPKTGKCWKCDKEKPLYRGISEERRRGPVCKDCYTNHHYPVARCGHCDNPARMRRIHPHDPSKLICFTCAKNYRRFGSLDMPTPDVLERGHS